MVQKRRLPPRESSFEQQNDCIKPRALSSLARTVSPPPTTKKRKSDVQKSASAAVEAGEKNVEDHLAFYSSHLLPAIRSETPDTPRISHTQWIDLYQRNAGSLKGCHFVVHQHDHPVAGTHYDLRLQCNPTSSISFAIMYGLPGDPNSRRLNRNATETRVHCLWNHLIETASWSTGSMLLWDTGLYEVIPYSDETRPENSDDNDEEGHGVRVKKDETEQEKLKRAFQRRKIKLRLHGTRLSAGYTLSLRLTQENLRFEQPIAPSRRRRRAAPAQRQRRDPDSDSNSATDECTLPPLLRRGLSSLSRLASPPLLPRKNNEEESPETDDMAAVASDDEKETIRANNAYTGATNDIGSIHQRKWFLSLDRIASGFVKKTTQSKSGFVEATWLRKDDGSLGRGIVARPTGFNKFIVGGRETERSVLTGRLASEILADEGVVGYVPRGMWRAVTE